MARAERGTRPRTFAVFHLAAQMLGKIRVAHAPWTNHGWHVALQPNARGLSTLPTAASGGRTFTLTLDLCRHAIVLWVSDGSREELPLNAGSIAALHRRLIDMLTQHGLPSNFDGKPNEISEAVPFAEDTATREYDREFGQPVPRSPRGNVSGVPILSRRFRGKASPVHFWWGASISPRACSRVARRRPTPVECPACRTGSHARPTAVKCPAAASGWAG